MDDALPNPNYKDAYAKGFSQAVKLFEYLCSKGIEQEIVIEHLKSMLAEDIRPWQQSNQQHKH